MFLSDLEPDKLSDDSNQEPEKPLADAAVSHIAVPTDSTHQEPISPPLSPDNSSK